jgi:hypothetical protein
LTDPFVVYGRAQYGETHNRESKEIKTGVQDRQKSLVARVHNQRLRRDDAILQPKGTEKI